MATTTIHGFLPNGVKVEFTFEDMPYAFALDLSDDFLKLGMLTERPVMADGEESVLIVTVMRRAKGDGTPIIDFYPVWGFGTEEPYGTYKSVHKYLNGENEVRDFLDASGFNSLEAIPLYDGQSPLKRTAGKKHPKETDVPTPFNIVRKQGKEKIGSDGTPYRPWELVRYETATLQRAQNAPQSHEDGSNSRAKSDNGISDWQHDTKRIAGFIKWAKDSLDMSHGDIILALRHFSFDPIGNIEDYEGDSHQAMAACIAFRGNFDVVSVASLTYQNGVEIPLGLRQLAVQMIEVHETPF